MLAGCDASVVTAIVTEILEIIQDNYFEMIVELKF